MQHLGGVIYLPCPGWSTWQLFGQDLCLPTPHCGILPCGWPPRVVSPRSPPPLLTYFPCPCHCAQGAGGPDGSAAGPPPCSQVALVQWVLGEADGDHTASALYLACPWGCPLELPPAHPLIPTPWHGVHGPSTASHCRWGPTFLLSSAGPDFPLQGLTRVALWKGKVTCFSRSLILLIAEVATVSFLGPESLFLSLHPCLLLSTLTLCRLCSYPAAARHLCNPCPGLFPVCLLGCKSDSLASVPQISHCPPQWSARLSCLPRYLAQCLPPSAAPSAC